MYFLMKPGMLNIFQWANQIWLPILAIFKLFFLTYEFYFDKLPPPPLKKGFKICFKSFFEYILVQKTVSEVLKTWYFPYSAFRSEGQKRGATSPPGYAIHLVKSHDIFKLFWILWKCISDYDTRIYERLLIKKYKPKLNRQLYGNGSSFFVKIILIDSVVLIDVDFLLIKQFPRGENVFAKFG